MNRTKHILAGLLTILLLLSFCVSCMGEEPNYDDPDLNVSDLHPNYQYKYYTRWITDDRIGHAANCMAGTEGQDRGELITLGRSIKSFGELIASSFSKEEGAEGTAAYLQAVGDAFLLFNDQEIDKELITRFLNQIAVARSFLQETDPCSPLMKKAQVGAGWVHSDEPELFTVSISKPPKADPDTMVITFGGNTFLGNRENEWETGFNAAFEKEKDRPFYPFDYLRKYFLHDDLTLLTYTGSISKTVGPEKDGRNGFAHYAKRMADCGVDAVALNSEYAEEFYESGLLETDKAFADAGIASYYDRKTAYLNTKLGKLALISYNIVSTKPVLDGIIRLDMAEANENGAKMIIVNFHWKAGKAGEVTKTQEKYARLASNLGADLVVGSHPDSVQGIAYTSLGRGIFYSLGDLMDGTDTEGKRDTGCLVQVHVHKRADGFDFTDFTVIPLTRSGAPFSPKPAEGAEKEAMLDRMDQSSDRLKDGVSARK